MVRDDPTRSRRLVAVSVSGKSGRERLLKQLALAEGTLKILSSDHDPFNRIFSIKWTKNGSTS